MDFRVLGPLEVVDGGAPVALGPPQERAVLAALLVEPGAVVSTDTLVDVLWGEHPPVTATNLVQGYVSALRRRLGAERVLSKRPGYLLAVPEEQVDARRFVALGEQGRHREALALWRGNPFGELDGAPFAVPEVARLTELRLTFCEAAFAADVDGGRHAEAIGEIEAFLAEHPLRERAWELLLLALYRSRRQADALRAYQRARALLREELGIEPGPALQELEAAILRQDASLERPAVRGDGIVVLLFTDLVASTEMLDALGDDEAEAVRRRHFRLLRDVVDRHGGTEVKSLGDGFMVTFASVVGALSCAGAIHAAVARDPDGLQVRIGVHVGEPILDEEDYFGTPVVVARRLCDVAEGGTTLVSDLVRGLAGARGGFVFHPVGPTRLKGLRAEVDAFTVDWREVAKPPVALPAILSVGERGAFAGRDAELAQLEALWADARAGARTLVLVAGEPGIGKTRLVSELAVTVHRTGAIVLAGRSDEDLAAPYQPFAAIVRQAAAAGVEPRDVPFAEQLGRFSPQFGTPPERAPTDADRHQLFDAVSSLLAALAERAPVLLVLDDLHWADVATLQLLRHVLAAEGSSRLLVVATYRDTELGRSHPLADALAELRRSARVERVTLGGLDEAAVAELAAAWSDGSPDEGFVREVHRETDGVPFFVQETLRHASESGDRRVPEGVKEVVGRRLSRLSAEADDALRTAAPLGLEFELAVVEAIAGAAPGALVDALAEAVSARVVVETGVDRYAFAHAIFRTTILDEYSVSQLVRLHLRAGEVLEELRPTDVDAIAHHYCEAAPTGIEERAAGWARRAGRDAMRRLAYERAADWFERAGAETRDGVVRFDALLELGAAQYRAGDRSAAEGTYRRAAALAREHADPEQMVRAALGLADWGIFEGADPSGLIEGLLADALPRLPEGDSRLRAMAMVRLAYERSRGGLDVGDTGMAEDGLAMARRLGDPLDLAWCVEAYLYVIWDPDHGEERRALSQEVVDLARAAGDAEWEYYGTFWLAVIALELGDVATWDVRRLELGDLAARLEQPRLRAFDPFFAACRAVLDGRWDDAEAHAVRSRIEGERYFPAVNPLFDGVRLLRMAYDRGRMADLIDLVEAYFEQGIAGPDYLPWRAWARAAAGRLDGARADLEASAAAGYGPGMRTLRLSAHAKLAEVACAVDDRARAAELYDLLLPWADRWAVAGPAPVAEGSVSLPLGMLAAALGRHDDAVAHLERAEESHATAHARPLLAHTRLHLAAAHLALGHADEARRLAALAHDAAAGLDMAGVLAGAAALLAEREPA